MSALPARRAMGLNESCGTYTPRLDGLSVINRFHPPCGPQVLAHELDNLIPA